MLYICYNPLHLLALNIVVNAPKLYFCDTGLAAYLTNWNNFEALEIGALSNEFFITWVTMEIIKSYSNIGKIPHIFYLCNFNGKEIELIIYDERITYPIAIKKVVIHLNY